MSGIKTYSQFDLRVKPTEPNHLARLSDVLDLIDGKTKAPVRVKFDYEFVGAYDPGTKTLTQATPLALVVDGVTVIADDRVLVADQTDKTQNGVYTVTDPGADGATEAVLTRAGDFDETYEITEGTRVFITQGDTDAGTVYKIVGVGPWNIDASNIEFVRDIVKYTEIAEAVFTAEGDGAQDEWTFTHNFGTRNISICLFDGTTFEDINAVTSRTSVNELYSFLVYGVS